MSAREFFISGDHDIIVLLLDGGKRARIAILQAGVLMDAQIWNIEQWETYIGKRMRAASQRHYDYLSLDESEK